MLVSFTSNSTLPPLSPIANTFCAQVSNKSVYNIILGAILCVGKPRGGQGVRIVCLENQLCVFAGALVSFLPQHVALLRSRSAVGLSWTWMLLSNIATWCLVFNVIGLSYAELDCCASVSFGGCMEILLPVFQVSVAALNMLPIFFM
jgi:hypothetical protein